MHLLHINRLIYSGPVEEEVKPMLTQKEFTSSIVKSLCGTFTSRKPRGRRSTSSPPLVRLTGHESINIVKRGAMKKGRCHECSAGPNKKRSRVETYYGCLTCGIRLCRDQCHDTYHRRLAVDVAQAV